MKFKNLTGSKKIIAEEIIEDIPEDSQDIISSKSVKLNNSTRSTNIAKSTAFKPTTHNSNKLANLIKRKQPVKEPNLQVTPPDTVSDAIDKDKNKDDKPPTGSLSLLATYSNSSDDTSD